MNMRERMLRTIVWLLVFIVRALFLSMFAALLIGVTFYALNKAIPIATLNPIAVYDGILEIKRDWPAFEAQLSESDRENHREILAFVERTDTGVLVLIAVGFDLLLIIIVLDLYLMFMAIFMFVLYLDDQSQRSREVAKAVAQAVARAA